MIQNASGVVVVGSLNMDLVMCVAHAPAAGETLRGRHFMTAPGGKGANQAVACARMGCRVAMVGRVGADEFGDRLRQGLLQDGIDIGQLGTDDAAPTGVAMILVEESGENRIVLASGANDTLSPAHVAAAATLIEAAALLIVQLEVPIATVSFAIDVAARACIRVLLNPAPTQALPVGLLAQVDLLVLNQTEATLLAGAPVHDVASAEAAARTLHAGGAHQVVVTLGALGVVIMDRHGTRHAAAFAANAIDTTAAGDSFVGGLANGMLDGMTLDQAAVLGMRAAALCITRPGAQQSIPYRHELAIGEPA